jgi:hypothetical protein
MTSRILGFGILALLGCQAGPSKSNAEGEIQVTVVVVLATDQSQTIGPRLECLAKEIQKTEPALTGFRLAKSVCQKVEIGKKVEFPLVEDEVASIVVKHGCDKDDRVGLTVKAPLVGEIAYSCACGKFFPIMTRYQTKDKERLIIAIRVQPCPCKKKEGKKQ